MIKVYRAIAALAMLAASAAANASYVTIEPDDYPAGTDLSRVDPGATLTMISGIGSTLRNPVLSVEASNICGHSCSASNVAASGTREFGYIRTTPSGTLASGTGWLYVPAADDDDPYPGDAAFAAVSIVLRVDFRRPVDWVSILFREDQLGDSDPIFMLGYDSSGELIAFAEPCSASPLSQPATAGCRQQLPAGGVFPVSESTIYSRGIRTLLVSGRLEATNLDRLRYRVDAPGAPLLGMFALVCLLGSRLRARPHRPDTRVALT